MEAQKARGKSRKKRTGGMRESGREDRISEESRKGKERRNVEWEEWGICFWNIAGLERKDRAFMQNLGQWEVIVMTETWLDEKGWERVGERLSRGYRWKVQNPKKKNKKWRAIGEC